MDVLLEELVEVLDAELDQYRDLLNLLRAHREFFAAERENAFQDAGES